MRIHISEIIEICRVEAIAYRLQPDQASIWRNFCRDYSKLFHTPYHDVLAMSPEFVILAVLEERLDETNPVERREDMMDRIYQAEDPNYESTKEQDLQAFIADAEAEEEERIKAGRPVFVPKPKKKQPDEPKKDAPKEGYINLAYLAKEEQGDEGNGEF